MNNKLYEMIETLEKQILMDINPPAERQEVDILFNKADKEGMRLPGIIRDLLEISDGLEVGVPGTVFLSATKMIDSSRIVNISSEKTMLIGVMSFGDEIYISENAEIIQFSLEDNEEFLRWNSIYDFLEDELNNCKG